MFLRENYAIICRNFGGNCVKNFTIETLNDYNNFCYLPLNAKEKVVKKLQKILKIDETKRFSCDKKNIKYLARVMHLLDKEALENKLNPKKVETFCLINRLRFINKLYIDIDAFNTFFFSYFPSKKTYTYDDLNILLQATYIYLMDYFNMPFESIEICKKQYNYIICYLNQKMHLELPETILENASSKIISKDLFTRMAVKQSFALAHEFAHSAIYRYIERNNCQEDFLFKEVVVCNLNKEFYNENHNNFSSEILANDFALDFVSYLLQGLIEPNKLQYEIELIKERIEKNKTCITFDTIDNAYTNILNKNGKEKTLKYIRSAFEKEN